MDSYNAERRALRWFVLSLVAFIISVAFSTRTTGPWPWLVPLSVSFCVAAWFQLWRHHRRKRMAGENDAA